MKEKLNIAAILKEKPVGTKLWSPIIGECTFSGIRLKDEAIIATFTDKYGEERDYVFSDSGRAWYATNESDVMLFPSKQMLDWSKFAWKKGDVLRFSDILVIFEKWSKDDYTEFKAAYEFNCHSNSFGKGNDYYTAEFCKAVDEVANNFVKNIEEHYGGKLNLSTLEIQKQTEFKDGDIVVAECNVDGNYILIFRELVDDNIYDHASLAVRTSNLDCSGEYCVGKGEYQEFRPATDSEKQQLFDALAKEGKRWNSETLQVEDLPKKCEFKPFDKVLVKFGGKTWAADFFSHYDGDNKKYPYVCVGYGGVPNCIPYNDQTAHLLGTTDEWKGGK